MEGEVGRRDWNSERQPSGKEKRIWNHPDSRWYGVWWAPLLLFSRFSLSDSLWPQRARQTSLSMRFPRQEYWSGLPFPPSGDLPKPGIEPTLALYHRAAKEALLHITPQTHEVSKLRRCWERLSLLWKRVMGLKLASGFDVRQQTDVERGERVQHKRKKKYFFF